jgi:hypothetical protein
MGRTKPKVSNDYVVGLTDGEGCFYVNMGKYPAYKAGTRVQMHFHLKMQERDKELLEKVRNTLDCGAVYFQKEKRKNHTQCYRYTVSSHEEIFSKVIPFFHLHPLQSASKRKSFDIFCQIASLLRKQAHLTKGGINRIRLLKLKMNQKTFGLA